MNNDLQENDIDPEQIVWLKHGFIIKLDKKIDEMVSDIKQIKEQNVGSSRRKLINNDR